MIVKLLGVLYLAVVLAFLGWWIYLGVAEGADDLNNTMEASWDYVTKYFWSPTSDPILNFFINACLCVFIIGFYVAAVAVTIVYIAVILVVQGAPLVMVLLGKLYAVSPVGAAISVVILAIPFVLIIAHIVKRKGGG